MIAHAIRYWDTRHIRTINYSRSHNAFHAMFIAVSLWRLPVSVGTAFNRAVPSEKTNNATAQASFMSLS